MTHPAPVLCEQCPWRKSNHGQRHPHGFYTKKNLRRLWNQIRRGGGLQTCHLTDPGHPDHVAAGAPPGAQPRECIGAIVLITREVRALEAAADWRAYSTARRAPLTREGATYYIMGRVMLAGTPLGGAALPQLDPALINDHELIGRLP